MRGCPPTRCYIAREVLEEKSLSGGEVKEETDAPHSLVALRGKRSVVVPSSRKMIT